ncbi:hypothetical protein [Mucilaginibacter terrae]|uniref:Fibronectin type-III domain-containing protein n=1 Tax=Mucilaginibacter terrae TaxID=1955052 RepID=A0ABU3GPA7_9SPHI|nr:hypothetical protein [Mucilaginibacter terrae]MDT3401627.1 hypothetical protein [Mucilaginibacter terrae]
MKKYISVALTALLTLVMFSCKKEADVAATEAKLPAIQLSSLGYTQTGPFTLVTSASGVVPQTIATVLQLYFGATTTNTAPGRFTLEFIEGTSISATSVVVKTVNFNNWKGADDTSLPDRKPTPLINHSITYTLQPTTYENTQVYGGSIQVKLALLGLSANKTYSVRATAYSADGTKTSVYNQLSFFKTI